MPQYLSPYAFGSDVAAKSRQKYVAPISPAYATTVPTEAQVSGPPTSAWLKMQGIPLPPEQGFTPVSDSPSFMDALRTGLNSAFAIPGLQGFFDSNSGHHEGPKQGASDGKSSTQPEPAVNVDLNQFGWGANSAGPESGTPSVKPTPENNAEFEKLLSQLSEASKRALAGQQKGVGDLERQYGAYQNLNPQLDLSPLMSLADTWYGGNLQKGYTKPASTDQRIQEMYALQQGLQKARGGLSEAETQNLKDQLMARTKMKEIEAMQADKLLKAAQTKQANAATDMMKEEKFAAQNKQAFGDTTKGMGKTLEALTQFKTAAAEFTDILRRNGGTAPDPTSDDWGRLQTLYNAMTIPWKDKANLGALSGDDVTIIKGTLGPQTFSEWLASDIMRKESPLKNMEKLIKANDNEFKRNFETAVKMYPVRHIADLAQYKLNSYNSIGGGSSNPNAPYDPSKETDPAKLNAYINYSNTGH